MDNLELYAEFVALPRHKKLLILRAIGLIPSLHSVSGTGRFAGESRPLLRLVEIEFQIRESRLRSMVLDNRQSR